MSFSVLYVYGVFLMLHGMLLPSLSGAADSLSLKYAAISNTDPSYFQMNCLFHIEKVLSDEFDGSSADSFRVVLAQTLNISHTWISLSYTPMNSFATSSTYITMQFLTNIKVEISLYPESSCQQVYHSFDSLLRSALNSGHFIHGLNELASVYADATVSLLASTSVYSCSTNPSSNPPSSLPATIPSSTQQLSVLDTMIYITASIAGALVCASSVYMMYIYSKERYTRVHTQNMHMHRLHIRSRWHTPIRATQVLHYHEDDSTLTQSAVCSGPSIPMVTAKQVDAENVEDGGNTTNHHSKQEVVLRAEPV